jgi:hypothetical protein
MLRRSAATLLALDGDRPPFTASRTIRKATTDVIARRTRSGGTGALVAGLLVPAAIGGTALARHRTSSD